LLTNTMGQRAVGYVENIYQVYDMSLLDPARVPKYNTQHNQRLFSDSRDAFWNTEVRAKAIPSRR